MSQVGATVAESMSSETTCAVCEAVAREEARDGWHVFDDGTGEEHALCPACVTAAPVDRLKA